MIKETAVPTKKTCRKFDLNFKREAVALWQNSGKPASQLGILEHQLYEWKKVLAPFLPFWRPLAVAEM
jgi:hypothetical protein